MNNKPKTHCFCSDNHVFPVCGNYSSIYNTNKIITCKTCIRIVKKLMKLLPKKEYKL
jgi:hypothetical protein